MRTSSSYCLPSNTRPLRGDLRDAFALGVDQMDIGSVEGGEVLVVEARAFAHEHVPRLERLGRRLVLHDLVNTLVDPHHVIDVGVFLAADLLLSRHGGQLRLLLIGELGFHQRTLRAAWPATRGAVSAPS